MNFSKTWNFLHIGSTHAILLIFLFEDFAISNLLSLYVEHLGKSHGLSFGDPKLSRQTLFAKVGKKAVLCLKIDTVTPLVGISI